MRTHKNIYAIVAALLLCVAFGAAPRAAAQPRSNGKIAFEKHINGVTDIFVMNADGAGERNLTETPFNESQAAWSPDGSRVVFASLRNAINNISTYDLYASAADGSMTTRLTTNGLENVQPSWSAREAIRSVGYDGRHAGPSRHDSGADAGLKARVRAFFFARDVFRRAATSA